MENKKIIYLIAVMLFFLLGAYSVLAITDDEFCKNLGYNGGCYCGITAADCNYCSGDPCSIGVNTDCITYNYTTTGHHAVCCYSYESSGSSCDSGLQCGSVGSDYMLCHYTQCDGSGNCSNGWACPTDCVASGCCTEGCVSKTCTLTPVSDFCDATVCNGKCLRECDYSCNSDYACDLTCGSDSDCQGKKPGAVCGTNGSCNNSCQCIVEPICDCTTGVCCDGCDYRPSTYVCDTQYATDYGCPWGTGCGDDVGRRYQKRYCSGSEATTCTGSTSWGSYSVYDYCGSTETCADNDSTCNYTAACDITCSDYDGNQTECDARSTACDWCPLNSKCYGAGEVVCTSDANCTGCAGNNKTNYECKTDCSGCNAKCIKDSCSAVCDSTPAGACASAGYSCDMRNCICTLSEMKDEVKQFYEKAYEKSWSKFLVIPNELETYGTDYCVSYDWKDGCPADSLLGFVDGPILRHSRLCSEMTDEERNFLTSLGFQLKPQCFWCRKPNGSATGISTCHILYNGRELTSDELWLPDIKRIAQELGYDVRDCSGDRCSIGWGFWGSDSNEAWDTYFDFSDEVGPAGGGTAIQNFEGGYLSIIRHSYVYRLYGATHDYIFVVEAKNSEGELIPNAYVDIDMNTNGGYSDKDPFDTTSETNVYITQGTATAADPGLTTYDENNITTGASGSSLGKASFCIADPDFRIKVGKPGYSNASYEQNWTNYQEMTIQGAHRLEFTLYENQPPTADSLSYKMGCIWPLVTLYFTYNDLDGVVADPISAYELQIDDNDIEADGCLLSVTDISRLEEGSSTAVSVNYSLSIGENLPVRTDYYWRVKVKDSNNSWSNWETGYFDLNPM